MIAINSTQDFIVSLSREVQAKRPGVIIETHEWERAIAAIEGLAMNFNRTKRREVQPKQVVYWSVSKGFHTTTEEAPALLMSDGQGGSDTIDPNVTDPFMAFRLMGRVSYGGRKATDDDYGMPQTRNVIFVALDAHEYVNNPDKPAIKRVIRDLMAEFHTPASPENYDVLRTLIFVSPTFAIPVELQKELALLELPLPGPQELTVIVEESAAGVPGKVKVQVAEPGVTDALVTAMQGLTLQEARYTLMKAVVATKELGLSAVPYILAEKKRIISQDGIVEYIDPKPIRFGHYDVLQRYGKQRFRAITEGANVPGMPMPRGCLLVGVPGCGKSLFAQLFGQGKLPVLRLDIGALFGGIVGETEANWRQVKRLIKAFGRCILWLDEIEKALGGGGDLDGGVSKRLLGAILTWMEEQNTAYVIATANNIEELKPELVDRFDDVIFVDLPDAAGRVEIAMIQIEALGIDPNGFDVIELASVTEGFNGRQLSKLVHAARYAAFDADRSMCDDDLIEAASLMVPIGKREADRIRTLRAWAAESAIPAASNKIGQHKKQVQAKKRMMLEDTELNDGSQS